MWFESENMNYTYNIGGKEHSVEIEGSVDDMLATLECGEFKVAATPVADGSLLLSVDGRNYTVRYARDEQGLHIMVKGIGVLHKEPGQQGAGGGGAEFEVVDGKQILVAPMPGQVVKVNVTVGDKVAKKQCVVIVEAMKMENELVTVIDGTVTAVHVKAGQQVDALQALVEVTKGEG
jgi:biotin carboxyl carrier protein